MTPSSARPREQESTTHGVTFSSRNTAKTTVRVLTGEDETHTTFGIDAVKAAVFDENHFDYVVGRPTFRAEQGNSARSR